MLPVLGTLAISGVIGSLISDDSKSESLINSAKIYEAKADSLEQTNLELQKTLNKAVKIKVDEEEKKLELEYIKQLRKEKELERIINEQLEIYKNTSDLIEKQKIKEIIQELKIQALKGE